MKPIILASTSPRRKQLLELIHLPFTAVASNYEEEALDGTPEEVVKTLALKKAQSVVTQHPDSLIIGADTLVFFETHTLGKPHTKEKAREMLQLINGQEVRVWTGVAIIDTTTGKTITDAVESRVWLKQMSHDEINAYVETEEPLDKSGAFAMQGRGAVLIKKIEGDYFNIVGLPLYALAQRLKEFGVATL